MDGATQQSIPLGLEMTVLFEICAVSVDGDSVSRDGACAIVCGDCGYARGSRSHGVSGDCMVLADHEVTNSSRRWSASTCQEAKGSRSMRGCWAPQSAQ
jgi:hypothetical protein